MMKKLLLLVSILALFPVLSCAPYDDALSQSDVPGPAIIAFSTGQPVIDLLCTGDEIWAGTAGGVARCDLSTGETRIYTVQDGLGGNQVGKIARDSHGNIWAVCHTAGVSRFDGTEWRNFTVEDGLISNQVITLEADSRGGIWVSGYWGVSYYDRTEWKSFTTLEPGGMVIGGENPNNPDAVFVENAELTAADVIFIDTDGNIWYSNRHDGVTRFDGETWELFTSEDGMADAGASAITEDREGNLWFGSMKGITRYDGSLFTVETIEQYRSLVPRPYVQDIETDTFGDIWVAAYGGVVCRYDGTGWQVYTAAEGLQTENGRFIFFDTEGNPGVVTAEGTGFLKRNGWELLTIENGFPEGKVRAVTTGDTGEVWFGSDTGEICRLR